VQQAVLQVQLELPQAEAEVKELTGLEDRAVEQEVLL
jgi:hypothetical protein